MNRRMARLLRSPAFLLVLVVVMIAAVAVVYAHWSTDAEIRGNVETGYVGVGFAGGYTNDDGWVNDWDFFDPDDDGGPAPPTYDNHPPYVCDVDPDTGDDIYCENSSEDPAGPGPLAILNEEGKDVASCYANPEGDESGNEWLRIDAYNTYPSYWCTAVGEMVNRGSIPIKAELGALTGATRFGCNHVESWTFYDEFGGGEVSVVLGGTGYGGDWSSYVEVDGVEGFNYDAGDRRILGGGDMFGDHFLDEDGDEGYTANEPEIYPSGYCDAYDEVVLEVVDAGSGEYHVGYWEDVDTFIHELTILFNPGQCGFQLDPGFDGQDGNTLPLQISMHVEQPALQSWNYSFTATQQFRNWNEFIYDEICG